MSDIKLDKDNIVSSGPFKNERLSDYKDVSSPIYVTSARKDVSSPINVTSVSGGAKNTSVKLKSKPKSVSVVDVFMADNPLLYSFNTYEQFPDFLKYIRMYKETIDLKKIPKVHSFIHLKSPVFDDPHLKLRIAYKMKKEETYKEDVKKLLIIAKEFRNKIIYGF